MITILDKINNIRKHDAFQFTLSSGVMTLANFLTGIILIKWIAPSFMGLWNSAVVIQAYSFFLQLGIFTGLNRELPYQMGRGNHEQVNKLASTASIMSIIFSLVSFICIIAYILFYLIFQQFELNYFLSFLCVSILILTSFYYNYLIVTFRSNQSFGKLSKVYLIQTVFILMSLPAVYFFGYYGHIFRAALLSIILLLITHSVRPIKIKPFFDKSSFVVLLKTGLPLFVLSYLRGITDTFGRLIILYFSGVLAVGYYSPALAIIVGMRLFPTILGQYIAPQMSFKLGQNVPPSSLWPWVWKSAVGLLAVSFPVVIIGWFVLPEIINLYFPKYSEGVFAAQLALISGALSSSLVGLNVLHSLKAWRLLIIVTGFKLLLYPALMFLFSSIYNTLTGVAIGQMLADLIFFIVGIAICYFALYKKKI